MRTIKFRYIWKLKDGRGFKTEYKTLDEIEGEDCWQGELPYELISRTEFTGLLDKNGKEIYESDVVEIWVSAPWDNEVPLRLDGEVVYEGGSYWFKGIKSNHEDDYLANFESLEVIGNKYEMELKE